MTMNNAMALAAEIATYMVWNQDSVTAVWVESWNEDRADFRRHVGDFLKMPLSVPGLEQTFPVRIEEDLKTKIRLNNGAILHVVPLRNSVIGRSITRAYVPLKVGGDRRKIVDELIRDVYPSLVSFHGTLIRY